jgi:ferredoxin--NADP+ reductase
MSSTGQAQPNLGRLSYRKDLTPDLAILRMQPADGGPVPDFRAGQFVTLGIQFPDEDRMTYRAYSISSPPEDKKADGTPDSRRLVLVASGTGLAPFISYILHLKSIGSKREIVLLHGAKYAQELGYRDILEKMAGGDSLNFKYLPTVSRPDHELSRGWRGSTGRVETLLVDKVDDRSHLEKTVGEKVTPENSFFHVCGYQGTIDSVVSILGPLGFVTNRSKRKDGSFDIKIETYG